VQIDVTQTTLEQLVSRVLKAKLLVGKVATPASVRFVHANTEIAGFEFLEPAKIFQSAIGAIFEPEIVGASLRQVQASHVHTLRFSDGRHTAIEVLPPGPAGSAFSSPPSGFSRVQVGLLGGEVDATPGVPILHQISGRTEPLSDFLRHLIIRILRNANTIPEPLRTELERLFTLESGSGSDAASTPTTPKKAPTP
jgi:hypothetical protein